jgi:hypothetical protein
MSNAFAAAQNRICAAAVAKKQRPTYTQLIRASAAIAFEDSVYPATNTNVVLIEFIVNSTKRWAWDASTPVVARPRALRT